MSGLLAKCQVSAAEMRPLWQLDSADKDQDEEVAATQGIIRRGTRMRCDILFEGG